MKPFLSTNPLVDLAKRKYSGWFDSGKAIYYFTNGKIDHKRTIKYESHPTTKLP